MPPFKNYIHINFKNQSYTYTITYVYNHTCVIFEMKISFGSSPVVSKTSNSSPKSQKSCDQIPCTSALMNCKMIKTSLSLFIYIKKKHSAQLS